MMSAENLEGSKAEQLLKVAKKEGREAAWNHLEHGAPFNGSKNPYEGIQQLAEAWENGYSDAENDYYFEQDNPDMFYDEDEEYQQDYVEREW